MKKPSKKKTSKKQKKISEKQLGLFDAKKLPKYAVKQLDMFDSNVAPPSNGVETSDQAADMIRHDTSRLRRIVWTAIFKAGGLTCDEVERVTKLGHQTASPRIWELHQNGQVEDSGLRRYTRRKRPAIVWKCTIQKPRKRVSK